MLRVLLLVILLSNLTGCALFEKKKDNTAVLVPEKVEINPESLKECSPLKELVISEQDIYPFVTVLDNIKENAIIYADCAKRQQNSVKLLKKFSNTDKETK